MVSHWLLAAESHSVCVGFAVEKVVMGHVFPQVLRLSPVSITPPPFHIQSRVIWRMENGPFSGLGSTETWTHPVTIKMGYL